MAREALAILPRADRLDDIRERVKAGKCLLCEAAATRRGLCTNDYFAFRRAVAKQSGPQAMALEIQAIRAGKILPANFCRSIRKPNPFLED